MNMFAHRVCLYATSNGFTTAKMASSCRRWFHNNTNQFRNNKNYFTTTQMVKMALQNNDVTMTKLAPSQQTRRTIA